MEGYGRLWKATLPETSRKRPHLGVETKLMRLLSWPRSGLVASGDGRSGPMISANLKLLYSNC